MWTGRPSTDLVGGRPPGGRHGDKPVSDQVDALDTGGVIQPNTEGVTVESTTRRAAERRPDPVLEHVQREHELSRAYAAAKTLEERLELAGLEASARTVRGIREEIHLALNALSSSTSPSGADGSSS